MLCAMSVPSNIVGNLEFKYFCFIIWFGIDILQVFYYY